MTSSSSAFTRTISDQTNIHKEILRTSYFYLYVVFFMTSTFKNKRYNKYRQESCFKDDACRHPFLGGEFGAHPKSNMPQPCYSSCPYILLECVECTPLSEWEDIFELSTLIWISAMQFWNLNATETRIWSFRHEKYSWRDVLMTVFSSFLHSCLVNETFCRK